MIGPVPLTIHRPLEGREAEFEEACEHREQHWSGKAGLGGDVRPAGGLTIEGVSNRFIDKIADGKRSSDDLRRLELAVRSHRELEEAAPWIGRSLRAAADFVTEIEWRRESMNSGAFTESLRRAGVPMVMDSDQDGPGPAVDGGHGRTVVGGMGRPENVRSPRSGRAHEQADVGELPLSRRLAAGAAQLRSLAKAGTAAQKSRLLKVADEMEALIQDAEEHESGNLNDVQHRADNLAAKYGLDEDVASFDDWVRRDTGDSKIVGDVDDQRDQLDLPDIPKVEEDRALGHGDEPRGAGKNAADWPSLPKGRRSSFGSAPSGRPRRRYSMHQGESFRVALTERHDAMTQALLDDLSLHYAGSHGAW